MQASDRQIVLESSAEVFMAKGRLAEIFYAHLFDLAPEARSMFSGEMVQQRKMFMSALALAIGLLGDRPRLSAVAEHLGQVHARKGIDSKHFALGARAFDLAIRDFFGEACTPEISNAWHAAYSEIEGIMRGAASAKAGHTAA
jgi:hemoglobin-like flavoprotein